MVCISFNFRLFSECILDIEFDFNNARMYSLVKFKFSFKVKMLARIIFQDVPHSIFIENLIFFQDKIRTRAAYEAF